MSESVLEMVPTRGERLRLDAQIAQFEVLPETEVLRTPGGQKRKHRARERKTGNVFANCQPPGLYKDHHSPTPFKGFPSLKNAATLLHFAPKFAPQPQICETLAPRCFWPSHPVIYGSDRVPSSTNLQNRRTGPR